MRKSIVCEEEQNWILKHLWNLYSLEVLRIQLKFLFILTNNVLFKERQPWIILYLAQTFPSAFRKLSLRHFAFTKALHLYLLLLPGKKS